MSRELHNNIATSPMIHPAAVKTANGTTTSVTIDTLGYESLEVVQQAGAVTDGTFTGTVFGGDASDMSDEAALAADAILGTHPMVHTSSNPNTTLRVGVKLYKRYYRLKVVQTGATNGGFIAAHANLGHAHVRG